MIRIHLVQHFYNPAYYDPPVDYLEEAVAIEDGISSLGKARAVPEIATLLASTKAKYLDHITQFFSGVLAECEAREANIVVFPEYSVPLSVIEVIRDFCVKSKTLVIAGSHRVEGTTNSREIYGRIGMFPGTTPIGTACVPILFPDGRIASVIKQTKSKWEQNLKTIPDVTKKFNVDINGFGLVFSVIPCIDSLRPEVVGTAFEGDERPHIVFCPSLSPSVAPFSSVGGTLGLNETLFAYTNTAKYGGTGFNIPQKWKPYIGGLKEGSSVVKKGVEAVVELDCDPLHFYQKVGTVNTTSTLMSPVVLPIISGNNSWQRELEDVESIVLESLRKGDNATAKEFLEGFLIEYGMKVPEALNDNLHFMSYYYLPMYDGNIDHVINLFTIIRAKKATSYISFAKKVIQEAVTCIANLISKDIGIDELSTLLGVVAALKKAQLTYPPENEATETEISQSVSNRTFEGDEYLIEAFQNRGSDLEKLRNYIGNPHNRLIVVTGPLGIGKTDFINWAFKKQFNDWSVVRISIPESGKIPRLVADIAYSLGMSIDIDALANASHDVFRQRIRKIIASFFSSPKRALVIDDLHSILRDGNARDFKQLQVLIEESSAPAEYVGGRIFVLSSQWLEERWLQNAGISHLKMRGMKDVYSRRVIEFHMRRCQFVDGETIPEPPQDILDIVKGHPLSAKLVVEAVGEKGFGALSNELSRLDLSKYIAKELLKLSNIDESEANVFKIFSVFRLPVNLQAIRCISVGDSIFKKFDSIKDRCVVNFDGNNISTHESIRRFYYQQLIPNEKEDFHKLAAEYYEQLYYKQSHVVNTDPSILCELIYHYCMSHQVAKASGLRHVVIEEVKPSARTLYKEYADYEKALELFRFVNAAVPDDVEVIAYIGRCFARIGQWADCDASFTQSIETAKKNGSPFWWIYRDWGQIKARYQYYDEAKKLFGIAEKYNRNDASIKSSLAYMYWKQGDYSLAHDFFEKAFGLNPNHEYTLLYFSRFLEERGDLEYAAKIRERYAEIEAGTMSRAPNDYDIDFENDD